MSGNYPLVYASPPILRLAIAYNPFDLTQLAKHELEYDQDKTLADYMQGLPEEVTWSVGYNGEVFEKEDWASVRPQPNTNIVLVRIPEGGKGAKSVLRIVALIAVTAFAAWAGPALISAFTGLSGAGAAIAGSAATAAITMAGGLIVNALLPATPLSTGADNAPSGQSYGIDGPVNTSREGGVVPKVYGDYRVGGNISDCYTVNVGDDQYLYMRTVVNDGPVADITDILINDQPVTNFTDVEVRITKGLDTDTPNDWFHGAVRQVSVQQKVKVGGDGTPVTHTTDGLVDKVRMDLVFPAGLVSVDDKGHYNNAGVGLGFSYAPCDPVTGNPTSPYVELPIEGFSAPISVVRNVTKAVRVSYESVRLPRGRYQIAVLRSPAESTDDKKQDAVWLTDVAEIDVDDTPLLGTATVSVKIKMTDQISGIPSLTALVHGSLVNIYDEDGNVVSNGWSSNPAWIAADILHNPITGAGFPLNRTIWPKFVEFAEFCDANNWQFNGVFDSVYAMWDALQAVTRVGHATVVPQGTKFSLAIDAPREPSMLFTVGNIYADTFQKSWVAFDDRANEIQIQFQDKDNGYKQSTLRLPNLVAQAQGAKPKPAQSAGFGITSASQATAEAEYQSRQNSYINSFITFDAPLEAIGLNLGEVALIQHDSIKYADGVGGRLEAGSTVSSINLDRPVTMNIGSNYTLLVTYDARKRADVTIESVAGNVVVVSGTVITTANRLKQGVHDVAILGSRQVGGSTRITVDDGSALSSGAAEVWETDAIEERDVVFANGDSQVIALATPLPEAPAQFANFMFGEKTTIKTPYTLRTITASDDLYRRTLSFVQYDDRVYEPGSWGTPDINRPAKWSIGQVRNLAATFDRAPKADQQRVPVNLSWTVPLNSHYAGADVYYHDDQTPDWAILGTANGTSFSRDFSRGDTVTFKVVAFDTNGTRSSFTLAPTVEVFLDVFKIELDPPTNIVTEVVWRTEATVSTTWDAPVGADDQYVYRVEYRFLEGDDFNLFLTATGPDEYPPELLFDAGWTTLPLAPTTHTSIPRLDMGNLVVRLRAEKGYSASPWAFHGQLIDAPGLPIKITGLKLAGSDVADADTGTFIGQDAIWTWDDILTQAATFTDVTGLVYYWQDYRVDILDSEGVEVRTEYTSSPSYAYTMAHNHEDSAGHSFKARREFSIRVRIRSKQLALSQGRTMLVNNPAPAAPTGVVETPDLNGALVNWDACTEVDYAGTIVELGSTAGFTPGTGVIVFNGKAAGARIVVASADDFYIRVGHYDTFDDKPTNYTDAIGLFIPAIAVEELTQLSADAASIHDEIDQVAQAALQLALSRPKDKVAAEKIANLVAEHLGTLIDNETSQRIDGDTATASVLSLLGAVSGDALSFVLDLDTVKTSPTETLADRFTQINSTVNDAVAAAISSEASTRASADSATASLISLIGAKNAAGNAFIFNGSSVQVSSGLSLADWKTSVDAIYGNAQAYADTKINVATGPGSSIATSISSLNAQVGSLNGSVTTLSSAVAGVQGVMTKYGVSLDSNGHVAGFQINNGSAPGSSSFVIVADKFALVDTSGGSVVTPFSVVSGFANFANPVTVLGTGSAKMIIGPAFGAASDLLMWFGPSSTSVGSASVANAIFALTVSGSTKIPGTGGGFSLSANATAISGTAFPSGTVSTNSVTMTPVNASGTVTYTWTATGGGTATASGGPSCAVSAFVPNGGTVEGVLICTATDGTKTVQFSVGYVLASSA